ncbi:MAG: serine/threonine protein kinase [Planctomycetes bacterium]|nr:serine/threonine protein kinase [Planctomycetota bacterium]
MPADAPRAPKAVPLHLGGEHVSTWRLGDYRVVRLLGEGAMGKVYEAVQESLQRRVALKVLPDDFAQDPDAVTRFEREARAAAALVHPSIVPIYQFGCEGRTWFYAMEFVAGRSLRDLLKESRGPLHDPKKVAKYVLNVALGLDYAHGQGVVHRDIKPDNILVREDDQALITDFGLARRHDQKAITQAGALMGTPTYMAPEQAMGRTVDARADVWALGVTLHECLSGGQLPFPSQQLRELLIQITQQEPPPLRALRPELSPDLEAIVRKCLRKEPQERYQTAKEVADELIRFFRGDVVRAREATRAQRALRQVRKHPLTAALGALLVLVIVGALAGGVVVSRVRAVAAAGERVAAAEALVGAPLAAWREAAAALERPRGADQQLSPPGRAAQPGGGPPTRGPARAEARQLDGSADADRPPRARADF